MNNKSETKSIKIISIFLIIIGLFITFFLGYIIKDFPYICGLGGFFLILIGCFILYLLRENDEKFKKIEKQLLENHRLSAGIFLFIGIIIILVSTIGLINGEFGSVWEEPLLYFIIGIIVIVTSLYYLKKSKN
jgi:hypothetical protein